MKINIVTESAPGWVLRQISENYAKHLPDCTVSTEPDLNADINLYINYDLFQEKTTIDVGYFTHREDDGLGKPGIEDRAKKFDHVAKEVDWCIAMSEKTAKFLPKNKTTVVQVAPDMQFYKDKIIFGVVAADKKYSPRKRLHWIPELEKIEGIEIKLSGGKLKWEELPGFFKGIDYLLILSDNEGGPIPLIEALAIGKPVITSDVGFADKFTNIMYKDFDDLVRIIKGLVIPKDLWETSAQEMLTIFENLVQHKGGLPNKSFFERMKSKLSK